MKYISLIVFGLLCASCAGNKPFKPKSDYPADPWVKGYADPQDCIGGEKLAARAFELPEYPKKAFNSGRQGWVILRLDVNENGHTDNVRIERAVPDRLFGGNARKAARKWVFEPPEGGALNDCRVLLRYRLGAVSLGG